MQKQSTLPFCKPACVFLGPHLKALGLVTSGCVQLEADLTLDVTSSNIV